MERALGDVTLEWNFNSSFWGGYNASDDDPYPVVEVKSNWVEIVHFFDEILHAVTKAYDLENISEIREVESMYFYDKKKRKRIMAMEKALGSYII